MVTDGRDIWTLYVALKSLTKPYTGGELGPKIRQIARWCLSFIKCSRCRRFMHANPRTKLAARDCGSFIEWLLILRLAVSGQRLAVTTAAAAPCSKDSAPLFPSRWSPCPFISRIVMLPSLLGHVRSALHSALYSTTRLTRQLGSGPIRPI